MERGSFGCVMQISRLFGVAPFKSYSISILLIIYGFILIIGLSAHEILYGIVDKILEITSLKAIDSVYFAGEILLVFNLLLGGYTSVKRALRFIRFLLQLQQMDRELFSEIKLWDKYVLSFLAFQLSIHILKTIEVIYYWYSLEEWKNPAMQVLKSFILSCIELQIASFASRVLLTFESINKDLKRLISNCEQENADSNIDGYPKKPKAAWETSKSQRNFIRVRTKDDLKKAIATEAIDFKVRRLSTFYSNICAIIRSTTDAEGFTVFFFLLLHMMYLQLNLLKIVKSLIHDQKNFDLFTFIMHNLISVTNLIIFVEPFHRTHAEMEHTSQLVHEFKCICGDRPGLTNELDHFLCQLLLLKTSYSPLHLCTLDRSLPYKILGALISYLVIMVTYGPEFRLPTVPKAAAMNRTISTTPRVKTA